MPERQIRRVEKILRYPEIVKLVLKGPVSVTNASHVIEHAGIDMLKIAWACAPEDARREFCKELAMSGGAARAMGEAKRRHREANENEIKGPASYEVAIYRVDDILVGAAMSLIGERVSAQALALVQAAIHLAERMDDRSLPTMLCAFCPGEFGYGERPTEIPELVPTVGKPGAPADRLPDMPHLRRGERGRQGQHGEGVLVEVLARVALR